MENFAQFICKPTLIHERKLKKVCEPLLQGFGVDTFWYYSLTKEGELSYICNNPLISEFFYSHELYKGHPYFKHPDLLQSGFFFADKTNDIDYIQTQGKLRAQISMDLIFMVMNVGRGKAEGYGFATMQKLPDLTNTVINNLYLFRKFINYFHQETEDILKKIQMNSEDIASQCGESFYQSTQYFDDLTSKANPKAFYKQIDPLQFDRLDSLTSREKDCLKWFLKGLSAVQIGKKIHLSNRTVEFYIENVKNKLDCSTKQELFNVLLDCRDFLPFTFF